MAEDYYLKKWIWTLEDFEEMCWHDCKIHAVAFDELNYRLLFDIDYIFKWVGPGEDGYYSFWVSPATLIFENVYDMNIDLGSGIETIIEDLEKSNPSKPRNSDFIKVDVEWEWTIETTNGQINFKSVGYKQYIKKSQVCIKAQEIKSTGAWRVFIYNRKIGLNEYMKILGGGN